MESKSILNGMANTAEIELVYRSKVKAADRPKIASASDAVKVLRARWEEGKMNLIEQFKILYLNRANHVLCLYNLSTGGVTSTVADPQLAYVAAIRVNASSLILCHNHPSGSLKPSRADEELTQKLKSAGAFLDIKVLDHIILSSEDHFSFADEWLL